MIIESKDANDTLVIVLSKPSRVARLTYYTLLLLIVAAIVAGYYSMIQISIRSEGVLRPLEGTQSFIAPFTAVVESVYVVENQFVKTRDTVLTLSTKDIDAEISQNHYERDRLQTEIEDFKKLVRLPKKQSNFKLAYSQAEYDLVQKNTSLLKLEMMANEKKSKRSKELLSKNLISYEEYENNKNLFELSQTKMEEYLQDKISRYQTDLFSKEASLASLLNKELLMSEERKKRIVTANTRGYVNQINFKKGGVTVTVGQELFAITPSTEVQAEFLVAPRDIGFVKAGLPIRYAIDAFPFQEWGLAEGRIVSVSNDIIIDPKSGTPFYKVIGSLNSGTLYSKRHARSVGLKMGLSFRASVIVAEKRILEMLYDRTLSYFVFH
jgi:HlyD family secretion protein